MSSNNRRGRCRPEEHGTGQRRKRRCRQGALLASLRLDRAPSQLQPDGQKQGQVRDTFGQLQEQRLDLSWGHFLTLRPPDQRHATTVNFKRAQTNKSSLYCIHICVVPCNLGATTTYINNICVSVFITARRANALRPAC